VASRHRRTLTRWEAADILHRGEPLFVRRDVRERWPLEPRKDLADGPSRSACATVGERPPPRAHRWRRRAVGRLSPPRVRAFLRAGFLQCDSSSVTPFGGSPHATTSRHARHRRCSAPANGYEESAIANIEVVVRRWRPLRVAGDRLPRRRASTSSSNENGTGEEETARRPLLGCRGHAHLRKSR